MRIFYKLSQTCVTHTNGDTYLGTEGVYFNMLYWALVSFEAFEELARIHNAPYCHVVLSLVLFVFLLNNLRSSHILILFFLLLLKPTGLSYKISAVHDLCSCKRDDCG